MNKFYLIGFTVLFLTAILVFWYANSISQRTPKGSTLSKTANPKSSPKPTQQPDNGFKIVKDEDPEYMGFLPDHLGKTVRVDKHDLIISVINWNDINDYQVVGEFRDKLKTKEVPIGLIFPYVGAGVVAHGEEKYINNELGSFHRYIGYMAQEEGVIPENEWNYVYQGFTKDDKYVSVMVNFSITSIKKGNIYAAKEDLILIDNAIFEELKKLQ